LIEVDALVAAANAEAWATASVAMKLFLATFLPMVMYLLLSGYQTVGRLQESGDLVAKPTPHGTSTTQAMGLLRTAHLHDSLHPLQAGTSTLVSVVGLMLVVGGWIPMFCQLSLGAWPANSVYPWPAYLPFMAAGGHTLGLALSPANGPAVRFVCQLLVMLWLAISVASVKMARDYAAEIDRSPNVALTWLFFAPLNFGCALGMADGLHRYGAQPQLLLRRAWALGRFLCSTAGLAMFVGLSTLLLQDPIALRQDPYTSGFALTTITFVCLPLCMTPDVRDKLCCSLCQPRSRQGLVP